MQQALLYLASIGDNSVGLDDIEEPEIEESYQRLRSALLFERSSSVELLEAIPYALVAQQMHPNPRRFAAWLAEGLSSTTSVIQIQKL